MSSSSPSISSFFSLPATDDLETPPLGRPTRPVRSQQGPPHKQTNSKLPPPCSTPVSIHTILQGPIGWATSTTRGKQRERVSKRQPVFTPSHQRQRLATCAPLNSSSLSAGGGVIRAEDYACPRTLPRTTGAKKSEREGAGDPPPIIHTRLASTGATRPGLSSASPPRLERRVGGIPPLAANTFGAGNRPLACVGRLSPNKAYVWHF